MYKHSRKQAGLSIEEAAFQLYVAPRTLSKYESGETLPGPDVALAMGRVYKNPALTVLYCRKECPIGTAYSYEYLNNINRSPQNIFLKLYHEYREAGKALERMLENVVNKENPNDFSEDEKKQLQQDLHHLLDLEHTIQVLKLELDRKEWVNTSQLISEHNRKCYRRGYVVDEQVKENIEETYSVPDSGPNRRYYPESKAINIFTSQNSYRRQKTIQKKPGFKEESLNILP